MMNEPSTSTQSNVVPPREKYTLKFLEFHPLVTKLIQTDLDNVKLLAVTMMTVHDLQNPQEPNKKTLANPAKNLEQLTKANDKEFFFGDKPNTSEEQKFSPVDPEDTFDSFDSLGTNEQSTSSASIQSSATEDVPTLYLCTITEADIARVTHLSDRMQTAFKEQTRMNVPNEERSIRTGYYYANNENKVEIFNDCGFYINSWEMDLIVMKCMETRTWREMVREILKIVYGSDLGQYVPTRNLTGREAICDKLREGLLKLVNKFTSPKEVTRKQLLSTFMTTIQKARNNPEGR